MAIVSLTLPVITHAVPVDPLKIQDTFYDLIKNMNQLVPDLIEQWVSEELKDLTEASTTKSRSISKVEVRIKGFIRGKQEDKSTAHEFEVPINSSKAQEQDRDRFLLSLQTGTKFTAGVVKRMVDKRQIHLKTYPPKEETENYQLLSKYFIENDITSGLKLINKNRLDPAQIQEKDKDKLITMALRDREMSHAILEHAMHKHSNGHTVPPECLKFVTILVERYGDQIKSTKDRVKNLESLFKKTIDSLAESFKNNPELLSLKDKNHVKIKSLKMRFSVRLDDGSQ